MFREFTFEERIIAFIEGKLAEGEELQIEKAFGEKGPGYYRADIYLPQGCKALDIPERSIIELRRRLQADTLYVLHNLFLAKVSHWEADNFIVIYENRNDFSKDLLGAYKAYSKDHFYVFSEKEFVKGEAISELSKPRLEAWELKRARIIMDARYDFSLGHNTLFLGAGLGHDVHMPMWNQLLGDLLNRAQANSHSAIGSADYGDIDLSCNHSALIIGRYIESGFKNMDEFKAQMHASLYQNSPRPTSDLYKALVKAIETNKVDQAITFNYDDLLETALMGTTHQAHSIFGRGHYSGDEFPVYHVHGMIPQSRPIDSTPVLSEKEYHNLYKESYHWSNVVQLQALSSTTCFFIGLSMNDPNLRRLLDISRNGMGDLGKDSVTGRACHYAILERKPLNPQKPDPAKDAEHIAMQERMMEDFGINVIWYEYDHHKEIPIIIKKII